MLDVGICGTDRDIARFEHGAPPTGSDILVIGHECLGRVVETVGVAPLVRVGQLVVPMVRRPCPHDRCTACRSGRPDFCTTGDYTERGIKGRHGYMTEEIVVDVRYLVPVPHALRKVGVLTEPLTIAEKALIELDRIQGRLPFRCRRPRRTEPGDHAGRRRHRALVLGAGPVGLLGAMAFAAAHYDVWVYSREAAGGPRARIVEAIDGHYLSARDQEVETLDRVVGPIDVVYEATGASRLAFEVMEQLGPNGVFVFTGVSGRRGPVELDTDAVTRRLVLDNQVVLGTVNAGRDAFEAAVRDLALFHATWPDALSGLLTDRHSPESAPDVVRERRQGSIKEVVVFDGSEGRS